MEEEAVCPENCLNYDVVIVGAGVAGLSAAIALKQRSPEHSVLVIEKAAEVGAHILSGAVIDPIGLDHLLPDWRTDKMCPLHTKVTESSYYFLTKKRAYKISERFLPSYFRNKNNYVGSLGALCRWLAQKAENLGVEIYPGFAATQFLTNETGAVCGVRTGEMGLTKEGQKSHSYDPGVHILAKYTLIAEGARGSLAKKIISHFSLDSKRSPQKYALGFKEIWKIPAEHHQKGAVIHTLGWPLDQATGGGGFVYQDQEQRVTVGFVVHLDYKNPYLSPFQEFQRFKTHPLIAKTLRGGQRLSYGARALTEGGWQSVPKLVFPGGVLIGCAAGFMNAAKLKGSHNAILSAIITAEYVGKALQEGHQHDTISALEAHWRAHALGKDLFPARNFKPLCTRFGTLLGAILGILDVGLQKALGLSLWGTLRHEKPDYAYLEPAQKHCTPAYPKPDNILTFDIPSSVFLTNLHYRGNQPSHLKVKDRPLQYACAYKKFAGPAQRYCPAGVYEWAEAEGKMQLFIHSENCIQCKSCDIKDPAQNIEWTCPEAGSGPLYSDM